MSHPYYGYGSEELDEYGPGDDLAEYTGYDEREQKTRDLIGDAMGRCRKAQECYKQNSALVERTAGAEQDRAMSQAEDCYGQWRAYSWAVEALGSLDPSYLSDALAYARRDGFRLVTDPGAVREAQGAPDAQR